jgi:choline dehydrogenase-like flavoprotein
MPPAFYDAIVVGSGASGGWAAKRLSEAGLRVAVLEAGKAQSDKDFSEHVPAYDLKYRDRADLVIRRTRPTQKDCYACREWNYHWFANDLEEPYTTAVNKPFGWLGRMRVVGGRTNVWGRQSYRLSEQDLKGKSFDGYGEDWPLSYQDLVPYYEIVEDYVGISGQAEGVPELPDSKFLPPMTMTCAEMQLRTRVKEKLGWTVTIGRTANLTRPIHGRAACHYCGPCEQGCATHSYFNAAFTTVADAVKTGKTTLITNAMAYKVMMDGETNKARGVLYIDRVTREAKEVRARVVILCAQALESTRILLNSATAAYGGGLANSSGVLGHYLMDHLVGGGASGALPDLPASPPTANSASRPNGIYVIKMRNTSGGPREKDYLRGFGYQGGGGTGFNWAAPGFGDAYKRALHQPRSGLQLIAFGEMLARHDNHVEIDPTTVDAWGIPVLRVSMTWGENEKQMSIAMGATAAQMLEAAGVKNVEPWSNLNQKPGEAIHEVGCARMGSDPKTSVLNPFGRTHDIENLYVMDGSGFVSSGCQNPTLTIMALTVRSCDYLLEEMRKANL